MTAEIATVQTKKDSGPDTRIIVGPYRIPLSRERFLLLERDLMTTAGFTKAEIHAEILRRLGVCDVVGRGSAGIVRRRCGRHYVYLERGKFLDRLRGGVLRFPCGAGR